jgi:beta-glucosidase
VTYDSLDVNLNDDNINIKVKIKNTSSLPLKEVVQVYIAAPRSKIIKPIHELRGFEKVNLKPNEEKVVSIIIPKNDLSYYNTRFGWTLESGNYLIQIGKSSQDILLEQEIYIQGGNNLYLYKEEVNRLFENDQTFLKMNKKEFEMVCHHFIPNRITYPYTMATPLVELDSFFGRRIYAMIKKRFVKALKKAHKIKDDNLRYIEEKNAIFQLEMMKSINLNMICFSSQGQVSYHQALGLLYLANGKIGLGIKNLLTHEKKFLK